MGADPLLSACNQQPGKKLLDKGLDWNDLRFGHTCSLIQIAFCYLPSSDAKKRTGIILLAFIALTLLGMMIFVS